MRAALALRSYHLGMTVNALEQGETRPCLPFPTLPYEIGDPESWTESRQKLEVNGEKRDVRERLF